MNRRLMMAQQNKGFELVYTPSIGVFPEETGDWEWYGGRWNGAAGNGKKELYKDYLYIPCKHDYQGCCFYITNHPTAKNLELSVGYRNFIHNTTSAADKGWLGLRLFSDFGAIEFRLVEDTVFEAHGINKHKKDIELTFPLTFKGVIQNGVASAYINDELIYQTNELKACENMEISASGAIWSVYDKRATAIGVKCEQFEINSMKYKEW